MDTTTAEIKTQETNVDFLPLKGWDYIEFYCGNAKQSSYYYQYALGFTLIAYSGLETGNRETASYLLQQGKIRMVLTSPLGPEGFITEHIKMHGDGVRDIALEVDDAASAYEETTKRGAIGVLEPTKYEDEHGYVIKSAIKTYGDTIHTFVERKIT